MAHIPLHLELKKLLHHLEGEFNGLPLLNKL
jgi:hypothetical protein